MANEKDLPAISLPNESTHVDIKPVNKAGGRPAPPAPKRPVTEQVKAQRPTPLANKPPAAPAKGTVPAPRRPASEAVKAQPAAAPAQAPRRPASEAVKAQAAPPAQAPRRPASEAVKAQAAPPAQAPRRPATEAVKAPPPAAPTAAPELSSEEDDPETLLRKYAERQKTKVSRLEQQLSEFKKVVAERDELRSKTAGQSKELESAKKQIEAASKSDEVIRDLQSRLDAAILSNTMLTDENGKLKKAVQDLQATSKKFEEKAATADRASVEAQKALATQTEARKGAEARISAAVQALQGDGTAVRRSSPPAPPSSSPPPAAPPPRRK